jgi:hypothetical protein
MTLYAAADGPQVRIERRLFDRDSERVEVVQQATYGRVLFADAGVVVSDCVFRTAGVSGALLSIRKVGA